VFSVQNHLLEMDAKKAPQPTWETVRYMISVIQYGGRITDDFDQLLMDTYAQKYFHQGVLQVMRLELRHPYCYRLALFQGGAAFA
jgi:hypothetical protein